MVSTFQTKAFMEPTLLKRYKTSLLTRVVPNVILEEIHDLSCHRKLAVITKQQIR